MPLPKIITCYTTISNQESADLLVRQLLDAKLIACGISWAAISQYHWKGESISEDEYAVYMKSAKPLKDRLISRIKDFHPYDVPCILIHELECNLAYYDWVHDMVNI